MSQWGNRQEVRQKDPKTSARREQEVMRGRREGGWGGRGGGMRWGKRQSEAMGRWGVGVGGKSILSMSKKA